MRVDKLPPVKTSLKPSNHPYLRGPWTPQHEEVDAFELEVLEGAIPTTPTTALRCAMPSQHSGDQ